MNDAIAWLALSAGLFLASVMLGAFWVARRRKRPASPLPGAPLRIKAAEAFYRTRLCGISDQGWWIDAPLQRDAYVPLQVGESIVVEATTSEGVLRFRTVVTSRDLEGHRFLLAAPMSPQFQDRREAKRQQSEASAKIEGEYVRVFDYSAHGMRCDMVPKIRRGERVLVELQGREIFGWTLETGRFLRIRFEEPFLV